MKKLISLLLALLMTAALPMSAMAGGVLDGSTVTERSGLSRDITGKHLLIVEDIVDTGNTIIELQKILADAGASESKVCTLLYKPEACRKDLVLDYVALEIPNDFIVGFGLDYDELGRNYKDIYTLVND